MRRILSGALLLSLFLPAFAQDTATPKPGETSCYPDRSVDEYIVELNKLKTKHGTHNPLPNEVCIFGLCSHPPGGPDVNHPDAPPPTPQPARNQSDRPQLNDRESSSKSDVGSTVPASTYDPVGAAQDADVGDYYFKEKNYRGALLRYEDAVEKKPGDAAIHLRIGRAFEKLGDNERAYLGYDSTVKLEPAGKSAAEAKQGMERLRPLLERANIVPSSISATNEPEKAPCLAPPASR